MKLKHWIVIFLTMAGFLTGCSKDIFSELSTPEKLSSSKWKVDDIQYGYGQSLVFVCDLDNTLDFSTNGSVILDRGIEQCNPQEEKMVQGYWELKENNSKIDLMGVEYELSILTKTDLRLYLKNYIYNNDTLNVYMLFKAIPR